MDPHKYSQLIFDKGAKAIQCSKDSLFNKRCWNNWTSTCKKINLDTDLTSFTKLIVIYVKCKTIKLLEDNIGQNLDDLGYGNDFSDITPKTRSMKKIIDKLDLVKIKNFCSTKDIIKRIRSHRLGENICKRFI